jgi:hypothetical protein
MTYESAVLTIAEENDLDIIDAELAAQELLVGNACKGCTLAVSVIGIAGMTCTCEISPTIPGTS